MLIAVGGLVFRYFGRLAPFQVTFCLLCFCTIFGSFFLPYIDPKGDDAGSKKKKGFLTPLRIFIPRKREGETKRDWNLFFLGLGTFSSVLATGYVPMALQLVGTNVFGFQPAETGFMLVSCCCWLNRSYHTESLHTFGRRSIRLAHWLMPQSLTLLVKAGFLSLMFPRIISSGRHWLSPPPAPAPTTIDPPSPEDRPDSPLLAPEPNASGQPRQTPALVAVDAKHGSLFDLYFLRYSIFLDGILTGCVSLATQGWHMYAAACVLPFASGTGPAAKGVTMDLVEPENRADALGAIALVEKLGKSFCAALPLRVFP